MKSEQNETLIVPLWYMVSLLLWLGLELFPPLEGATSAVTSAPYTWLLWFGPCKATSRAVREAKLPEARPVPVTGARAMLPVVAALAIVAAEIVKAEAEGPFVVRAATAVGEHHGFVDVVGGLGLGRCRCRVEIDQVILSRVLATIDYPFFVSQRDLNNRTTKYGS